jgi:hypothetical protein
MEETFEEYLKEQREDLVYQVSKYPVQLHIDLRVAVDSMLIAYDQAVEKALRPSISDQEQYDQGFHDGANKTAIELSKQFVCNKCSSNNEKQLTHSTSQCGACDTVQSKQWN